MRHGWHGSYAMRSALHAEIFERNRDVYIADCLGMITRQLYATKDFPLFSEIIDGNSRETKQESAQEIKDRIVQKLLA